MKTLIDPNLNGNEISTAIQEKLLEFIQYNVLFYVEIEYINSNGTLNIQITVNDTDDIYISRFLYMSKPWVDLWISYSNKSIFHNLIATKNENKVLTEQLSTVTLNLAKTMIKLDEKDIEIQTLQDQLSTINDTLLRIWSDITFMNQQSIMNNHKKIISMMQ